MREKQKETAADRGPGKERKHLVLKGVAALLLVFVVIVIAANILMFAVSMRIGFFHRWAGDYYLGKIVEIKSDNFVMQDREGRERTVLLTSGTMIKDGMRTVDSAALAEGEYVMVAGPSAAEGGVEAKIVRIFDASKEEDQ